MSRRITIDKNNAAWFISKVNDKLYYIDNLLNPNAVWQLYPMPRGNKATCISIDNATNNQLLGIVMDNTDFYISNRQDNGINDPKWAFKESGVTSCTMLANWDWFLVKKGVLFYVRESKKLNISIATPGPVTLVIHGMSYWVDEIHILVGSQTYWANINWGNVNKTVWNLAISGRPTADKKWLTTTGEYDHLYLYGVNTLEWINRRSYVSLKTPATLEQIELNYKGVVIAMDTKGIVYWSNDRLDNVSNFKWNMNNNKLPNPNFLGTYYGNSKVSPKAVTITLDKGNTDGIPVLNWRRDIEWHYNSCGFSSRCGGFNRSSFPFSDNGMPVEASGAQTEWVQKGGQGNCTAGKGEAWCFTPNDFLTHVFGQGAGNDTIPAYKKQYTDSLSKANAWDLQITPFAKVMNTTDGTMNTFNADYRDVRWMDNNKAPTFASLKFNLPDPTQPIDIDTTIPYILLNYHKKGWLELAQLNDYLGKYLFTNVNVGNKQIPRINIKTGTGILPINLSDLWKSIIGNSFLVSSTKYCKNTNLAGEYCQSFCRLGDANCDDNLKEFCATPGKGKLPSYTNNGILPTTPVTQKILDDAFPNYSLLPGVCGCNMPKEYYKQLDIMTYQGMKEGERLYSTLFAQGGIGGRPNCDPLTICKDGGSLPNKSDLSQGGCPPIAIQNCIQENKVIINGQASGVTAQNTQAMNCLQKVDKSDKSETPKDIPTVPNPAVAPPVNTVPSTPPAAPPVEPAPESEPAPVPKSSSGKIAVIILIILLMLMGGGYFIFLK